MNARDLAEQAQDLFVLPDSFIRIKELIDDDTSTIDDIADVVLLDPALAATILKLANSALFNYPGKIDSVSKAMLVLGITEVYNLVITYFTTDTYKNLKIDANSLEAYWEQSVDTALYIKYFGKKLGIHHSERLFILGLLHNIGELLAQQFLPEKYQEYVSMQNANAPWQNQQQLFGFTFGECSAELMKFWRLPFCLIEPVLYQDDENFEHISEESRLLYLAKRVALSQHFPQLKFQDLLNEKQSEQLRLTEQLLEEAIMFCNAERFSILAMISPSAVTIY